MSNWNRRKIVRKFAEFCARCGWREKMLMLRGDVMTLIAGSKENEHVWGRRRDVTATQEPSRDCS
jgi:hypothetical protein